jgi:alpha-ketoglutarate-dependent taurine dioxygenase
MRIERTWRSFGARVEDLDLAAPLDDATKRTLREPLDIYAVEAFPAQFLDDAQLQAVSLANGELDMSYEDYGC